MIFESYERRIDQINKVLNENGIKDINEAKKLCDDPRCRRRPWPAHSQISL